MYVKICGEVNAAELASALASGGFSMVYKDGCPEIRHVSPKSSPKCACGAPAVIDACGLWFCAPCYLDASEELALALEPMERRP